MGRQFQVEQVEQDDLPTIYNEASITSCVKDDTANG